MSLTVFIPPWLLPDPPLFPFTPNFVSYLLLLLMMIMKRNSCCAHIHGCASLHWDTVDLSGAALLKKMNSAPPSSHRWPSDPQLWVGLPVYLLLPCRHLVWLELTQLAHADTRAVSSRVRLPCHVQRTPQGRAFQDSCLD